MSNKVHAGAGPWLAVISVAFWGMLPVVSKGLLDVVDAYTLNFYRFVVATILLSFYLYLKGQPAVLVRLQPRQYLLLIAAVIGLLVNHLMFMDALNYIPAGASQMIIQLGPIALLLLSVFFLREPFTLPQWLGVLTFSAGLLLFFNDRLPEIFSASSEYAFGILYMTVAALIWIFYGMGQKLLTGKVVPVFLLLCCYSVGVLVLLPVADVKAILSFNPIQLWLLAGSCFTSLLAYICFGESLVRWEASKSSALLAFIPLVALCYENIFALILPQYVTAEQLNWISFVGAALVVGGCLAVTRKNSKTAK